MFILGISKLELNMCKSKVDSYKCCLFSVSTRENVRDTVGNEEVLKRIHYSLGSLTRACLLIFTVVTLAVTSALTATWRRWLPAAWVLPAKMRRKREKTLRSEKCLSPLKLQGRYETKLDRCKPIQRNETMYILHLLLHLTLWLEATTTPQCVCAVNQQNYVTLNVSNKCIWLELDLREAKLLGAL